MKHETYKTLRAGLDKRPWLVIGGPHDGLGILLNDAHLCEQCVIPKLVSGGFQWVIYRVDHDGHCLEYVSEQK